jgi:hypothetical protein
VRASALRFRPEGFDATAWLEANRPPRPENAGVAPAADGAAASAEAATAPPQTGAPAERQSMGGGGGMGSSAGGFGGGGMGGGTGAGRGRQGSGAGGAGLGGTRGPNVIFALDEKGEPQPRLVRVGLSDGQFLAVMDGVNEGDVVVTGVAIGAATNGGPQRAGASPSANPFQPQRPQQRRRE